jgi:hypothetical protein
MRRFSDEEWAQSDLNRRPPGYQPGAPAKLSYGPMGEGYPGLDEAVASLQAAVRTTAVKASPKCSTTNPWAPTFRCGLKTSGVPGRSTFDLIMELDPRVVPSRAPVSAGGG